MSGANIYSMIGEIKKSLGRWGEVFQAARVAIAAGVSWQEADMNAGPSATSAEPLLDVRAVSAGYGGMPVLRDVTLKVYPGENVWIMGV